MEERLLQCIQAGNAPHALLIAGPAGCGKAELARRAAARYCFGLEETARLSGYPDYLEMNGADTNVKSVRALMATVAMRAFGDARRAFVILDAHCMRADAQNALLKVLEEPPADTMVILTGNESGLLPTIRSRCMIRRIGASEISAVAARLAAQGVPPEQAEDCALAADGVFGLAESYASESGAAFRSEAIRLLTQALFSVAPFSATAELIAEDAAKEGKKKRADAEKAARLLAVWADVLRDALLSTYGVPIRNRDAADCSKRIFESFTEIEMQSIIEALLTAQQRLFYRASPALTLDAVLSKMCLKEKV